MIDPTFENMPHDVAQAIIEILTMRLGGSITITDADVKKLIDDGPSFNIRALDDTVGICIEVKQ